jgi:hypothetical protein
MPFSCAAHFSFSIAILPFIHRVSVVIRAVFQKWRNRVRFPVGSPLILILPTIREVSQLINSRHGFPGKIFICFTKQSFLLFFGLEGSERIAKLPQMFPNDW